MMERIKEIAEQEERVRILTLEGSRTNKNIQRDEWQGYDITFCVEEVESFMDDEEWMAQSGNIIMMQIPGEITGVI